MNNEADSTGAETKIRFVPFDEVHAEMVKKAEWAKLCMPAVWERFIAKLEAKTFTLDEITREHKRIKNLHGSVEEHRKAFMEAVEECFDMDLSQEKRAGDALQVLVETDGVWRLAITRPWPADGTGLVSEIAEANGKFSWPLVEPSAPPQPVVSRGCAKCPGCGGVKVENCKDYPNHGHEWCDCQ